MYGAAVGRRFGAGVRMKGVNVPGVERWGPGLGGSWWGRAVVM